MNDSIEKPYYEYSRYLDNVFGHRLQRISIDLGFGCPNRDTNGNNGCIYCGDDGARAVHLPDNASLVEQVHAGINYTKKRYNATNFMAYFQAYTSTNAPIETIRKMFSAVLAQADFQAITVSTRPDCLPIKVIDYFAELSKNYDFWVELGIQTANDETLVKIKRGHDFACSKEAVRRLTSRGIKVAAHIIIGLPGETHGDLFNTAAELSQLPLSGIKIHNLHVVVGTEMAMRWQAGYVNILDEHEYADLLIEFLRRIPESWPIMRLMSDTPRHLLLAPHWWLNKGQFQHYLVKQMNDRKVKQGDLCGAAIPIKQEKLSTNGTVFLNKSTLPFKTTKIDPKDLEKHRNTSQLSDKSTIKGMLDIINFPSRIKHHDINVLDIGFGAGLTIFGAMEKFNPLASKKVRIIGLGPTPAIFFQLKQQIPNKIRILRRLERQRRLNMDWGQVILYWGDPRRQIFRVRGCSDVIILEPKSYEKSIDLYTFDFLRRVCQCLSPDGVFVSAVSCNSLRNTLHRLGLHIGTCNQKLVHGGGTVASWSKKQLKYPLNNREKKMMTSTLSSVPYRDFSLTWSKEKIMSHRQQIVERLKKRGWVKRLK